MKKVVSASRRVELLACFPQKLVEFLEKRLPPEKVHTIVLWTKNANVLLNNRRVREVLSRYDQIYIHYTITGMGGTLLEPYVPRWESLVERLPEVIDYVGSALRVNWRFDPIVHIRDKEGRLLSNFPFFPVLAERILPMGIRDVTVSWLSLYPKVTRRLAMYGLTAEPVSLETEKEQSRRLESLAHAFGARVHYCCMEGFPRARCIDGAKLTLLHPKGEPASTQKAENQRPLCGCPASWDIGWYYACPYGCLYCYANPKIFPREKVLAKGWIDGMPEEY